MNTSSVDESFFTVMYAKEVDMAPRNAITKVKLLISMFKFDNWDGFSIIIIPSQPAIEAKIIFFEIFSFIRIPAKIDINIGYVYWITVEMFIGIIRIA